MTGITVVTSDKSLDSVKNLFIQGPLSGTQYQAKKMAWFIYASVKRQSKLLMETKKESGYTS